MQWCYTAFSRSQEEAEATQAGIQSLWLSGLLQGLSSLLKAEPPLSETETL